VRGLILALVCLSSVAAAESKVDTLFKRGKQQLADKKYAEACATFEEVDKLEPGIGAKLNVARCYEEWEKLAVAYRWYDDAQKMAVDTKDKRAAKIKELIDALDSDVPRLTVKLPAKIDPFAAKVKLDGKAFSELGTELRVDPGQHVIDYQSGTTAKKKTVNLERGASTEVELVFDPGAPLIGQKPPPAAKEPTNTRKVLGIASTSAGVIALGVAGVLTLTAKSKYNAALDDHCMGATNLCDAEGLSATNNAKKRANHATIISIVGGAAIAAGVVLYVTAPKKTNSEKRAYLAPSVSSDSAAVIFGGRF
jgi:tetratricopeptide (TPR) repeat protein